MTLGVARATAIARAAHHLEGHMPEDRETLDALAAALGQAFDLGREHGAAIAEDFGQVAGGRGPEQRGQRRMATRIAQMIREEAE